MADVNSIESATTQELGTGTAPTSALAQNPVLQPLIEFEFAMLNLELMLEAFCDLSGENPPPWLGVVLAEYKRLDKCLAPVSQAARAATGGAQ